MPIYFEWLGTVHKRRPQSEKEGGRCPVRTSTFLVQKSWSFSKYMVCSRTDKGIGPVRTRKVNFSRFCVNIFYDGPFISGLEGRKGYLPPVRKIKMRKYQRNMSNRLSWFLTNPWQNITEWYSWSTVKKEAESKFNSEATNFIQSWKRKQKYSPASTFLVLTWQKKPHDRKVTITSWFYYAGCIVFLCELTLDVAIERIVYHFISF